MSIRTKSIMRMKKMENSNIKRYALFLSMFIGLLLITPAMDNDIWFILNSGRYVLANGIPVVEPFTVHEGLHFVLQQWLTDVLYWEIYRYAGMGGLLCMLHIVGVALIYAYYRLVKSVSRGNESIAIILSTITGILVCAAFVRSRPQILSSLIFILEIFCMESYLQKQEKKYILWLPILSLMLINLHAAMWPMLIVFLLPYLLENLLQKKMPQQFAAEQVLGVYPFLGAIGSIILFGFINPYGWEAMSYVFRSYGYEEINMAVDEMNALSINFISGKIYFAIFLGMIIIYARKSLPIRYVLLSAGTMYMALTAARSIFLFLVIGTAPLAFVYRACKGIKEPDDAEQKKKNIRIRLILIVLLAGSLFIFGVRKYDEIYKNILALPWVCWYLIPVGMGIVLLKEICYWKEYALRQHAKRVLGMLLVCCLVEIIFSLMGYKVQEFNKKPPVASAIEFLLKQDDPKNIRLWTDYDQGGIAEFMGIKCYIDPRAEVFLKENNQQKDIFHEYVSLELGQLHYREFIKRYQFSYYLTTDKDILYTYLANDPDYQIIYEEEDHKIRIFKKIT